MNSSTMARFFSGRSIAFKIAGIYLFVGALWILLSDQVVAALVHDQLLLTGINSLKGLLFISTTALLVYGLIRRHTTALRDSEERYRNLYENAPIGIYRTTPGGQILASNPALVRMLGYASYEELAARNLEAAPDATYARRQFKERVERAGRITGLEAEWLKQDGTRIFVREHAQVVRDANGQVLYYDGTIEDITERRLAEEAIRQSQQRYESLVHSIDGIVWEADAQTLQFSFVSQPAERLLGYPCERWLTEATFWQEHIHPDDREWAVQLCINATREKRDHEFEYRMIAADGRVVWLHDFVTVIVEQADAVTLRGIMVDVTAGKQRERQLEVIAAAASALRAAPKRAEIIPIILDQLHGLFNIESSAIAAIDLMNNEIVIEQARGAWWAAATGTRVKLDRDMAAMLGHTTQVLSGADLRAYPFIRHPELIGDSYAVAVVSLIAEEIPIGLLAISRSTPMTEDEERLLKAIGDMAAGALHRTLAYEQAQRRAEQLATVNTLGRALTELLDLPHICERLSTAINQLLPDVATTLISLFDPERQLLTCIYAISDGRLVDFAQLPPLPLGTGPQSEAVRTRQPVIANDLQAWSQPSQRLVRLGEPPWPQSAVFSPMLAKGAVIGVVQVQSYRLNRFTPEDSELLSVIANTAAVAIHNARLLESEREQHALAEALRDTAALLNRTLDFDEVLDRMLTNISRVVPHDAANIMLVEPDHTAWIVRSRGYDQIKPGLEAAVRALRFRVAEVANLRYMVDTGESCIVSDTTTDPDWIVVPATRWVKSHVGAPIRLRDSVVGFINLDSLMPHFFTPKHAERLKVFADQAATAIANARMFEETQRRLTEQAALLEAGTAVSSSLDLTMVLQRLAEQLGRAIDVTSVYVCQWDQRAHTSTVLADYYAPSASERERVSDLGVTYDLLRDFGTDLNWLVTGQSTVVHVDDPDTPEPRRIHLSEFDGKSVLIVSLTARTNVFGYIELWDSRHRRNFTPDEIALCQGIARQAAVAFENARLFEAERKQLRLAQTLQAVGALLTAEMRLDDVFNYLFDLLARVVSYDSVSVQLFEGERTYLAAGRGFPDLSRSVQATGAANAITLQERWSQPHRRVIVIPDTHHDASWSGDFGNEHARSWIGAALRVKGRVLGILNVDSSTVNTYDEAAGETVAAFANQAAIAIENAQLHDAVRRHADQLEGRVIERTVELDHERRRMAAILDTAGEGIVFTDVDGAIEYINPAMQRLTGYAADEALRHNPRIWQSGATSPALYHRMWDTIKRGQTWQGELVNRRKDGTLYDASMTIAPLKDADDKIVGFVGVQRDITQQKELDRLKDEFVSNVSHELRTPIANVKLYLSLLTRGKPEKRDEYMQTLRRETARLEKLIEDLLDLSRLDLSTAKPEMVLTDLNQLTAQLVADRSALAANRRLSIDYQAEDTQVMALSNPAMLVQVLSNLLTNAINYTPPGGSITLSIAPRERDGQSWAACTVKDTGPGVSPADLPHLFERFYRGEAGRKSGAHGTGLGLAISHKIVDRMGGHITIESEPGYGAAFTVWLKQP